VVSLAVVSFAVVSFAVVSFPVVSFAVVSFPVVSFAVFTFAANGWLDAKLVEGALVAIIALRVAWWLLIRDFFCTDILNPPFGRFVQNL
jgi:hypothetical protein